jgi:putative membrane protein
MSTGELLTSAWDWEPSVVAGCAVLVTGYLALVVRPLPHGGPSGPGSVRPPNRYRKGAGGETACFLAGVLLLLMALVSPLDTLGDGYLLSAHIAQHFLLALVIPPLWLLGTPREFAEAALRYPAIARIERRLSRPATAWGLGVGTMLLWHVPVFFNAALANDPLHIVQHLSFLITGAIFWWPILHPIAERRYGPLPGIAYLFTACIACSLLGAALTFSPVGLYPAYLNPENTPGILRLIRDGWGLDAKSDQQLGGMLMWVPGCFVYVSGILLTAVRWYGDPQEARA